jgi:hypothetical protein
MASVTQSQGLAPHLLSSIGNNVTVADPASQAPQAPRGRDVNATFNYYKDSADGSPPAPNYANKPSTYVRERLERQKVVQDIRGREDQYTLDTTGFQIVKHESAENDL